jgi:surfactin synthase thioesterase subunit
MTCLPFSDTKPGAAMDLFCLNYAGGSTAVFRDWNRLFPDWISVRPVEFPGRGTRMGDQLISDPARLADLLSRELEDHIRKPFAIFGHSLGAALGYRIALHFQTRRPAVAFFPSGRHSPTASAPVIRRAHLPDGELLEAVRELNGSPAEVLENAELMAFLLPIIRADFALSETIRAERDARLLTCPVHVFGGADDTEVPVSSLAEWQTVAKGDFSETLLPGDHFFMHSHIEAIRDRIIEISEPLVCGSSNLKRRA